MYLAHCWHWLRMSIQVCMCFMARVGLFIHRVQHTAHTDHHLTVLYIQWIIGICLGPCESRGVVLYTVLYTCGTNMKSKITYVVHCWPMASCDHLAVWRCHVGMLCHWLYQMSACPMRIWLVIFLHVHGEYIVNCSYRILSRKIRQKPNQKSCYLWRRHIVTRTERVAHRMRIFNSDVCEQSIGLNQDSRQK